MLMLSVCRLIVDRDTGKGKGFGFAEYYDKVTAESAFRNLNNAEVHGRNIRIDFAEDNYKNFRDRGGPHQQNAACSVHHSCHCNAVGAAKLAYYCMIAPVSTNAVILRCSCYQYVQADGVEGL